MSKRSGTTEQHHMHGQAQHRQSSSARAYQAHHSHGHHGFHQALGGANESAMHDSFHGHESAIDGFHGEKLDGEQEDSDGEEG